MKFYKDHYDVIVIGGALAGLSSALMLADKGLDVLVLERHNLPGGIATSFVRGGIEIEAALHEMMSIGPEGNRLKVTVRFRGREMAHTNIGEQLLRNFAEQCSAIATMDKNPKLEGRNMSVFLSPKAPDKQSNKK